MKSRSMLAVLAMLGACGVARAQGYFDFDSVVNMPEQPSVQVDLNAAMLGIAAAAAGNSDPTVAAVLAAIEGIRVRAYPKLEDARALASFIEAASGRLESDGWERVVYAQDGAENVRVYARMEGDAMNGLTVMALSEDKAALVNIAGLISAEQFGRMAAAMSAEGGIPQLALSAIPQLAR